MYELELEGRSERRMMEWFAVRIEARTVKRGAHNPVGQKLAMKQDLITVWCLENMWGMPSP